MLFQHMLQQTTHDDDTHVGYFNMAVFAVYSAVYLVQCKYIMVVVLIQNVVHST